jgi:hypothetical protein
VEKYWGFWKKCGRVMGGERSLSAWEADNERCMVRKQGEEGVSSIERMLEF